MGRRRQARELALKILFQMDLGMQSLQHAKAYTFGEAKASRETQAYAERLTDGVAAEQKYLDTLLTKQTHHWRLERLSAVDRNILRLGAYELYRCPDVPRDVAINEAIEIAKKYCTEESGKFVNGILDGLPIEENGEPRRGREVKNDLTSKG